VPFLVGVNATLFPAGRAPSLSEKAQVSLFPKREGVPPPLNKHYVQVLASKTQPGNISIFE
jgi:hypothetical protein